MLRGGLADPEVLRQERPRWLYADFTGGVSARRNSPDPCAAQQRSH